MNSYQIICETIRQSVRKYSPSVSKKIYTKASEKRKLKRRTGKNIKKALQGTSTKTKHLGDDVYKAYKYKKATSNDEE